MNERNMIIGFVIVILLAVGVYFVFAQDLMCTGDGECAQCERCVDGNCEYQTCGGSSDCRSSCYCNAGYCSVLQPGWCAADVPCSGACERCEWVPDTNHGICVDDSSNCGDCQVCSSGSCQTTCTGCESCVGGNCEDDSSNCGTCGTCTGAECFANSSNCGTCEYCSDGLVCSTKECETNNECEGFGSCGICDDEIDICVEPECSDDSECDGCDVCINSLCKSPPAECGTDSDCTKDGCLCIDSSCQEAECSDELACTGSCEYCIEGSCITTCTIDSDCPETCICSNEICIPRPIIPPRPEKCKSEDLGLDISIACEENVVLVKSNGDSIKGVTVRVVEPGQGTQYEGTTNDKGEFSFNDTSGATVDIYALDYDKGGICYDGTKESKVQLKTDVECLPPVVPPEPPPPKPPPEPKDECSADTDCGSTSQCSGGSCVSVSGTCGYADNHTWVNYECCADADCNPGYVCESNKCVLKEYDLQGKGGFAGDSSTVTATLDGDLLANTDVRVTKPDGSYEVMTTDNNGEIKLALLQAGDYKVDLLVNGTLKKSITVKALPKTPVEPSRPTFFDVLAQNSWVLLIILVVGIGAYMLLRKPRTVRKKPGRLK